MKINIYELVTTRYVLHCLFGTDPCELLVWLVNIHDISLKQGNTLFGDNFRTHLIVVFRLQIKWCKNPQSIGGRNTAENLSGVRNTKFFGWRTE